MTQSDSLQHRANENLAFFSSELFKVVQTSGIFSDSKIFADAVPKNTYEHILTQFELNSPAENNASLLRFIERYFELPCPQESAPANLHINIELQIKSLWRHLGRQADKNRSGSLLPLSSHYIVPGGRFREIYYWDSYFTALGLIESGKVSVAESMLENFIELQSQYGCIPNGNRSYYLSRSQPPILAMLVELLLPYQAEPEKFILKTIVAVTREYDFWMDGHELLNSQHVECKRVVRMPNGSILNRYWDNEATPRPESFNEDIELAAGLSTTEASEFFRNIRAACESGWDFSSRWMQKQNSLTSIRTTRIVPIDLNSLIYKMECLVAEFYLVIDDKEQSNKFANYALERKSAIKQYLWSEDEHYFMDFDLDENTQSPIKSLAGVLPLFVELVSEEQSALIAKEISEKFLKVGGLVTTNIESSQQWDAPNGWAPLQWFAVKGLLNYQQQPLAKQIMLRWLDTVNLYFEQTGKLMEKYNVCDQACTAGGGEYDVQEGFGWTNGVYQAFLKELKELS